MQQSSDVAQHCTLPEPRRQRTTMPMPSLHASTPCQGPTLYHLRQRQASPYYLIVWHTIWGSLAWILVHGGASASCHVVATLSHGAVPCCIPALLRCSARNTTVLSSHPFFVRIKPLGSARSPESLILLWGLSPATRSAANSSWEGTASVDRCGYQPGNTTCVMVKHANR